MSVYVLDGEVSIETSRGDRAAPLGPGRRQAFRRSGGVAPTQADDTAARAAWADGRLVMRAQPLGAVLAELARYHTATVSVAETGLEGRTISGVVPTYDLSNALETIATALQVRLARPGPGAYVLGVADPKQEKR